MSAAITEDYFREKMSQVKSNLAEAFHRIGNSYECVGNLDDAERLYRLELDIRENEHPCATPALVHVLWCLMRINEVTGHSDEAECVKERLDTVAKLLGTDVTNGDSECHHPFGAKKKRACLIIPLSARSVC